MPVIDYHNHLLPADIMKDRRFRNLTEAWLEGDHYKWRAMRANGIEESYITGNRKASEKFQKWGETVPHTLRNPLYHWTHLELKRYFGIDYLLNEESAQQIYEHCNELLTTTEYSCRGLLRQMNVEVVCTTDDPADSLGFHREFSDKDLRMFPAFRPDRIFATDDIEGFNTYVAKLEEASQQTITTLDDLLTAYRRRIEFFHSRGCRISDHGLEQLVIPDTAASADSIFMKVRSGNAISKIEREKFMMTVLHELSLMYHEFGWVQQFHLGAIRNNNSRLRQQIGADAGCDSIGDFPQAAGLARFLDSLDSKDRLTKTVLYNLNPADNSIFATMAGNFNDGSEPGKIQYGAAWWFLDQHEGIRDHLDVLSNMGLLSRFIGMLTDSRSFLSFPRHEYFRRILCDVLGGEIEKGLLPDDLELCGELVQRVCYFNTLQYFAFPEKENL
jgi:glucuronate isomerase